MNVFSVRWSLPCFVGRFIALSLLLVATGCGGTTTLDRMEQGQASKPSSIVVSTTLGETADTLGSDTGKVLQSANLLADDVVLRLRRQGIPVARLDASHPGTDVLVLELNMGEVEAGSRWKRTVIGFGYGRSHLQVGVDLKPGGNAQARLLTFQVDAGSGREPGAAVALLGTAGGSLLLPAAQGALSAAHLSGLGIDKDLDSAAGAIMARLDQYFRLVGWTDWTSAPRSSLGGDHQPLLRPVPRGGR